MEPNKPQQKMLAKLEEIGELEDVSVRGDVVLRLAGMRLRIEKNGRLRYFDGESSDRLGRLRWPDSAARTRG